MAPLVVDWLVAELLAAVVLAAGQNVLDVLVVVFGVTDMAPSPVAAQSPGVIGVEAIIVVAAELLIVGSLPGVSALPSLVVDELLVAPSPGAIAVEAIIIVAAELLIVRWSQTRIRQISKKVLPIRTWSP